MHFRFKPIAGRTGEMVDRLMESEDIPSSQDIRFKVRLALEEVLENVVSYAYADGQGYLDAETILDREHEVLRIVIRDSGIPFNPLLKADPDLSLPLEERPVGGLGIFLCKQLMDGVSYCHEDGCNVLTLVKKLN